MRLTPRGEALLDWLRLATIIVGACVIACAAVFGLWGLALVVASLPV